MIYVEQPKSGIIHLATKDGTPMCGHGRYDEVPIVWQFSMGPETCRCCRRIFAEVDQEFTGGDFACPRCGLSGLLMRGLEAHTCEVPGWGKRPLTRAEIGIAIAKAMEATPA
jgi:hypothetical protein